MGELSLSADALLIGLVAVSAIVGVVRGLVAEAMSLAGWFVAFGAATWALPHVLAYVPVGEPGSALNHAAAFVSCFLVVLVAWAMLTMLLRLWVRKSALSGLDRLLGGAFGVTRGLVVVMVIAVVVLLTPLAQSSWWQQSALLPWAVGLVKGVRPLMPPSMQRWLPA